METHIELLNHDAYMATLIRAGAAAGPAFVKALKQEADDIFRDSQEEVPFRFGPLKGSGRVSQAGGGEAVEITISYGGSASAYALYQHEGHRQDGTHQIHNYGNGKKGKYLEDPVNNHLPGMEARLAARLKEILGF